MKIQMLTATLVEMQLQKIELKLRYLDELQGSVGREWASLDNHRKRLIQERQHLAEQRRAAQHVCTVIYSPTRIDALFSGAWAVLIIEIVQYVTELHCTHI